MNQVITLYNVHIVAGQSFVSKEKTYYAYEIQTESGKRIYKGISTAPVKDCVYIMYQLEVRGSVSVLSSLSESDLLT